MISKQIIYVTVRKHSLYLLLFFVVFFPFDKQGHPEQHNLKLLKFCHLIL